MGLKFYSKELPTLESNIDQPFYVNTSVSYYKTYHCTSGLLPCKTLVIEPIIDLHPYASVEKSRSTDSSMKNQCSSPNNTYANISGFTTHLTKTPSNKTITNEDSSNQHYENLRSYLQFSSMTTPLKLSDFTYYENFSTENSSSNSSSHTYVNLTQYVHKSSIIPTSSCKYPCSTIENKQVDIDTSSNTNTIQITKKLEVNLAPSCSDKSVLYRTKMPNFTTSIPSSFRQRRRSVQSKRNLPRNIKLSPQVNRNSNIHHSKLSRQQSKSDRTKHASTITDDSLKRSFSRFPSKQSPINQVYQEIEQSTISDEQSEQNSIYSEAEVCENPVEFHRILQSQVLAWHPIDNPNEEELIAKFSFTAEQDELDQEDQISIDEDDDDKLCRHETFEDFFLRRPPPKSSCSTVQNGTSPVISETISNRETPKGLSRLDNFAPTSIALSLDRNDVKFIHDIIQRSYGDRRKSNRIIALREAYIRALNKKLKAKTIRQTNVNGRKAKTPIKHSYIDSKIRNELEQYDELPLDRIPRIDDNDIYSLEYRHRRQHCSMPTFISTLQRIFNFVVSVKRHVQRNFQDMRLRMNVENPPRPTSRYRHTIHSPPTLSQRHRSRPISTSSSHIPHLKTNYHSTEHIHRHHSHPHSQSNRAQTIIPNRTSPNEQRLSYRPRTFRVVSNRARLPRID